MLRKEDNDWVKKCMEYEVKSAWPEIVEKVCQARNMNREDAMNRNRWRKQIRDVMTDEWVNVSYGTSSPRWSRTKFRMM